MSNRRSQDLDLLCNVIYNFLFKLLQLACHYALTHNTYLSPDLRFYLMWMKLSNLWLCIVSTTAPVLSINIMCTLAGQNESSVAFRQLDSLRPCCETRKVLLFVSWVNCSSKNYKFYSATYPSIELHFQSLKSSNILVRQVCFYTIFYFIVIIKFLKNSSIVKSYIS